MQLRLPHPSDVLSDAYLRKPRRAAPLIFRRDMRIAIERDQLLNLVEILLDPLVLVVSLWVVAFIVEGNLGPHNVILSLIVFSVTFPGTSRLTRSTWRVIRHILLDWLAISGLLLLFAYASGYLRHFNQDMLITWWWVAPLIQVGACLLFRLMAPTIRGLQGPAKLAVVAGMNMQGVELAEHLDADVYSNIRIRGFFDDRSQERRHDSGKYPVLGNIANLPDYVKKHHISRIYLSLPMASQQRVVSLLDRLRDTTGSIYFVPDTFVTDLIQGRMGTVGGTPVVAVCETPFTGVDGIIKRTSDVVLSLLILVLVSPLLLLIALGVKLSSPGPVLFRQRRYGLDGNEIIVYKFRSMNVTEDGDTIQQARKLDTRVTPLGAFLRRSSLDELPQFLNVLQGRMSIVGPRPHAVAHNELYRKLIRGYMLRHKVKPGITGWAQVNGLRGETETVEKMKARIDYDLDYLRNWTLPFDLYIIAKTVGVVLKSNNAY